MKKFDIDADRLERYLVSRLPELAGRKIALRRHPGGHSCETWQLTADDQRWILRRPPRAHVQHGASNMAREFRVMAALAGSEVPVPRMILLCEDSEIIGAPFLIMEDVAGVVLRHSLPEGFDSGQAHRRAIGLAVVDTLVELHRLDWQSIGLAGHGNPEGFLERNLDLMRRQWQRVHQREIAAVERLSEYLFSHVPDTARATIVHGDYKLDNIIWATPGHAEVAAVVDWEVSTIADPRIDLGWLRGFWTDAGDARGVAALGGGVLTQGGFPSREEIVDRYCQASGHSISDLEWFEAFAMWKIAIIMEASYMRHLQGASDDPLFASLESIVPLLAEAGVSALAAAGRL